MCVVIMFLINWQSSLITFIVILGLYLVVVYRKPGKYATVIISKFRLFNNSFLFKM